MLDRRRRRRRSGLEVELRRKSAGQLGVVVVLLLLLLEMHETLRGLVLAVQLVLITTSSLEKVAT